VKVRRRNKRKLAVAIDQGRRLLATGQHQEAFEFLEEAVRRFPEDAEIRLLYASILLAFRPEDVAVEAAKAIELGPDDPSILVRAAHLLLQRGEVRAARSWTARANELVKPEFVLMSALESLEGRIAALDGDDDLAEEKLRNALEHDPAYSTFAVDLAKFLAERGRRADAVDVIREALGRVNDRGDLERMLQELEAEDPATG
jgi:Flp pilus assembly protein TadD